MLGAVYDHAVTDRVLENVSSNISKYRCYKDRSEKRGSSVRDVFGFQDESTAEEELLLGTNNSLGSVKLATLPLLCLSSSSVRSILLSNAELASRTKVTDVYESIGPDARSMLIENLVVLFRRTKHDLLRFDAQDILSTLIFISECENEIAEPRLLALDAMQHIIEEKWMNIYKFQSLRTDTTGHVLNDCSCLLRISNLLQNARTAFHLCTFVSAINKSRIGRSFEKIDGWLLHRIFLQQFSFQDRNGVCVANHSCGRETCYSYQAQPLSERNLIDFSKRNGSMIRNLLFVQYSLVPDNCTALSIILRRTKLNPSDHYCMSKNDDMFVRPTESSFNVEESTSCEICSLLKIIWAKAFKLCEPRVVEILLENGFAVAYELSDARTLLHSHSSLDDTPRSGTVIKLSELALRLFYSHICVRDLTVLHYLFLDKSTVSNASSKFMRSKNSKLVILRVLSELMWTGHMSWMWHIPIERTLVHSVYGNCDCLNANGIGSPVDEMAKYGYWDHVLQFLSSYNNAGMIFYCQKFRSRYFSEVDSEEFDQLMDVPVSPLIHWAMIDARVDFISKLCPIYLSGALVNFIVNQVT